MPARLPKHLADDIDRCLRENLEYDPNELANSFHTTYSTVMKRKRKIRLELVIGAPIPRRKPGRRSKITRTIEVFIQKIIELEPDLYQEEICDFIYLEYGAHVKQPQLSKVLDRLNQSRKVCTVRALQCDQELVRAWRQKAHG